MNKLLIKIALITLAITTIAFSTTLAYFSSSTNVNGNLFSTGYWPNQLIINELYFNTGQRSQGAKTEREGDNEWVELYNPNPFDLNIKNYTLTSTNGTYKINANLYVPANGLALLSHDHDTWIFWSEPNGTLKINLGGKPKDDWLVGSGDYLILKNSSGVVLGAVSWGDDKTYCNLPTVLAGNSLSFVGPASCNYLENNPPTPGVK